MLKPTVPEKEGSNRGEGLANQEGDTKPFWSSLEEEMGTHPGPGVTPQQSALEILRGGEIPEKDLLSLFRALCKASINSGFCFEQTCG